MLLGLPVAHAISLLAGWPALVKQRPLCLFLVWLFLLVAEPQLLQFGRDCCESLYTQLEGS